MKPLALPRQVDPRDAAQPYVGPSGWVGGTCGCGFRVSARTLSGMFAALTDRQESDACAFGVQVRKLEAEEGTGV